MSLLQLQSPEYDAVRPPAGYGGNAAYHGAILERLLRVTAGYDPEGPFGPYPD